MAQTLKQSVTGMMGWGGIQQLLQDQLISTSGTIGAALIPLISGDISKGVVDFGAAMYKRGAYQLRIKTPPSSVIALLRTLNADGSANSAAESLDSRGPGGAFGGTAPYEVALEVSNTNFPTGRNQVVTVGVRELDSVPGEVHVGPVLFITDPFEFRFARVVLKAQFPGQGIAYDVEIVAVP